MNNQIEMKGTKSNFKLKEVKGFEALRKGAYASNNQQSGHRQEHGPHTNTEGDTSYQSDRASCLRV